MQRDSLVVQEGYYLRIKSKQVPVMFCGFMDGTGIGSRRLQYKRLDTGETLYRRNAGSVSRHTDECWNTGRTSDPNCACRTYLKAEIVRLHASS